MIAYYQMCLKMKFQIFSSVKSIAIIKKIRIFLFTFSTFNQYHKHVSGILNATKVKIRR